MIRWILGGIVGGLVLFANGFLFFGTSLSNVAFQEAPTARVAAVQQALAHNLDSTGTGAYEIPDPRQPGGTKLLSQGPVATVFFENRGLTRPASNSFIGGIGIALLTGLLLATGLRSVAVTTTLGQRSKLVLLFALAFTVYRDLGQPVFNPFGWTYFLFSFAEDMVGFAVAGLVIARWFLPAAQPTSPSVPDR